CCFFFQAEDGIRDLTVTGVQTCALPICWGTGMITARNPRQPTQTVPNVDHVSYWVDNWDSDTVKAELEKRGLTPRLDLGDASSPPQYVSFHIKDPDGTDVQIAGVAQTGDSQFRKG